MQCPKCKQTVASRDHQHYGVHFASVTDAIPCPMSCKSIIRDVAVFDEQTTITVVISVDKGTVASVITACEEFGNSIGKTVSISVGDK